MTQPDRPPVSGEPRPSTDDDWPRCKRCDDYEWNHRDGALGHQMSWPAMTARELRVADRIMEALR